MRKIIFGGLLASTMLVPAFAQNNPPGSTNPPASTTPSAQPSTPPAKSSAAIVAPKAQGDMWRASKLVGLNVYNDQNEKLGDISEILLDKSGKVDGVVIGVGGFLGMGKHDILVQLDKLKFVNEPVKTSSTTPTSPTSTTGSAARPAPSPSTSASTSSTKSKWYPDHAVMSGATKESLKNMAEFKFD
jgi:sporulation protein YlmC with PRC-barrel domain